MKKTMIYLVSAIAFLFTFAGCEEVKINENRGKLYEESSPTVRKSNSMPRETGKA